MHGRMQHLPSAASTKSLKFPSSPSSRLPSASGSPSHRRGMNYAPSEANTHMDLLEEYPESEDEFVDDVAVEATADFAEWAADENRWEQIIDLFTSQDKFGIVNNGVLGGRTIDLDMFTNFCLQGRFKGDSVTTFKIIALDCKRLKGEEVSQSEEDAANNITLKQFKRFQDMAIDMNCGLDAGQVGSPAHCLVQQLKRLRGTTLRAWRADLDRKGLGRLTYQDFASGLRKLGLSGQARNIWNSLRQKGQESAAPLELGDLDPEEASNLERFTQTLWDKNGFDLKMAWDAMDTQRQHVLTLQEFSAGADRIGFQGDVRLLYRGLDSQGLGRLRWDDFEYLRCVSRTLQKHLADSTGLLRDFISWVRRDLGGPEVLLVKVGCSSAVRDISVSDLAARLTALGYPGDALQASVRMARYEGGVTISADSLFAQASGYVRRGPPMSTPKPAMKPKAQEPKQAWNDSVFDHSRVNQSMPTSSKMYFSVPERNPERLRSAGSSKARSAIQAPPPRPEWNASSDLSSTLNSKMPPRSRKYFSDFDDKPVKETLARRSRSSPNFHAEMTDEPPAQDAGSESAFPWLSGESSDGHERDHESGSEDASLDGPRAIHEDELDGASGPAHHDPYDFRRHDSRSTLASKRSHASGGSRAGRGQPGELPRWRY